MLEWQSVMRFASLMVATVFIAAGGYIINDYFDQNIDQINKPDKVVVNRIISRRWVIFWHLFLSLTGLLLTIYALPVNQYWHLLLANIFSVFALWFYSTTLKKKLLIGNVLISLLTAWVIGILFFAKFPLTEVDFINLQNRKGHYFRLMILYASFAFIISLIREVIKDMEDVEGDRKYGCTTMPIALGIVVSKVFVSVWMVVLIAALLILQIYALGIGWWASVVYAILLVITPLLISFKLLMKANTAKDFHQISTLVKFIMFTGILSMIFFKLYP
jgi:4-hydroxybenzoate polyprenyltransferase